MLGPFRSRWIALVVAGLLSAPGSPALAASSVGKIQSEPAPPMTDVLVMRPLGMVMLGVSTALFVPMAGITLLTRPQEVGTTYQHMVAKPARFVFKDPIGSH